MIKLILIKNWKIHYYGYINKDVSPNFRNNFTFYLKNKVLKLKLYHICLLELKNQRTVIIDLSI